MKKKSLFIISLNILLIIAISGAVVSIVYVRTGLLMPYYVRSLRTERVSVSELKAFNKDNLLIVDVRTESEHQASHIPGSILIPIQDLDAGFGIEKLEQEILQFQTQKGKSPQIILYCRKGPRSIRAFETLKNKIELELFTLTGGMTAWEKES